MTGHIDPERAAFEAFKALPRDEPIQMLNLIRLHEQARYSDGRIATGRRLTQLTARTQVPSSSVSADRSCGGVSRESP